MMLPDILKDYFKRSVKENDPSIERSPLEISPYATKNNVVNADDFMAKKNIDPNNIYNDSGSIVDYDPGGVMIKDMLKLIGNSRANNDTGPSVLKQLLSSVLGGGLVPNTGTVGGDPAGISGPTHTPGTQQDAALNPQPMAKQKQPSFSAPLPQPRMDYSQPSALDPVAIEQLRMSLLSDSGQLDPNNPNGLAGRMTGPNSQVDANNQRKEVMSIEDSVRGFDGSRKANIQKGNSNVQR